MMFLRYLNCGVNSSIQKVKPEIRIIYDFWGGAKKEGKLPFSFFQKHKKAFIN